ncbi:hypothetical protein Taro_017562 [Colocasia esculenta]|uniref:Uncharacterized protein n=1 Tax=Colocasia esculenta TaxID=4460 RepID=A0A843URN8_COLES|nr:hypothetical protein [Colocasia esculenta]
MQSDGCHVRWQRVCDPVHDRDCLPVHVCLQVRDRDCLPVHARRPSDRDCLPVHARRPRTASPSTPVVPATEVESQHPATEEGPQLPGRQTRNPGVQNPK